MPGLTTSSWSSSPIGGTHNLLLGLAAGGVAVLTLAVRRYRKSTA
jgi:hypothetical protein